MRIRVLVCCAMAVMILCAVLLPWSSRSLGGTGRAAYLSAAGSWHEMGVGSASGGGISHASSGAWYPSMAIAPDGTPYVAWEDYSGGGNSDIYVRRWNGSSWVEVGTGSASGGGISNNSGDSYYPSVAIAPNGTPYVAWHDGLSWYNNEIYVRRWNGSSWEEVGAGSASSGGISNNGGDSESPSLAMAPDGTPYVAWRDSSGGDYETYVRCWNGSGWEEVGTGSASGGGISNNSGDSYYPSMAVAPDGTPYVAWNDWSSGESEIYVLRWNGSSWVEVGAGSASGEGISHTSSGAWYPSMAIAPYDTPYVAWADEWLDPPTPSRPLPLASCDMSCTAWKRYSGEDAEIYVRLWNGSSWEEVGAGSASDGGISNNSGNSERPSLAIAPDGALYVAWQDYSSGNWQIYARRWRLEIYLPIVLKSYRLSR